MTNFKIFLESEMTFEVGIPKDYFPKEKHPKEFTLIYDRIRIKAENRTDAAKKAWAKYGKKWLSEMKPHESRFPRGVSLYVNSPKAPGNSGLLDRLTPIKVQ